VSFGVEVGKPVPLFSVSETGREVGSAIKLPGDPRLGQARIGAPGLWAEPERGKAIVSMRRGGRRAAPSPPGAVYPCHCCVHRSHDARANDRLDSFPPRR